MKFLRNVIKLLIFILIILWIFSFLGYNDWFYKLFSPSREVIMERAQKIGDFSAMDGEFEIEKVDGFTGFDTLVAAHKPTGQKMYIIDPADKIALKPQDLIGPNAERALKDLFSKVKAPGVSPDDLLVTKQGIMEAFGEEVPFVEFTGKSGLPGALPIGGFVSTAKTKDGERIMASTNDNRKYSHIVTNNFFYNISKPPHHPHHPPNPSKPEEPCVCP
ncbi:MAG: hypothetical protein LBK53_06590 [Heliobacteriaceae bacterium]|jgi:hypothetical protein|nr:hypothetical protein [Heliobacteriaceae bacterium]